MFVVKELKVRTHLIPSGYPKSLIKKGFKKGQADAFLNC